MTDFPPEVVNEDWLRQRWDVRDEAGNPVKTLKDLARVMECSEREARVLLKKAPVGMHAPFEAGA